MIQRIDFGSYDVQLILNFTALSNRLISSQSIVERIKKFNPQTSCFVLDGYVFLNDLLNGKSIQSCGQLFKTTDRIKITVIAHGRPGIDYVDIYKNKMPSAQLKIEILAELLKQIIGNQPNVVINLISCGGARGVEENPNIQTEKSIASCLHENLYKKMGRDILVIGRTQLMLVHPSTGKKATYHINGNFDKEGGKIIRKQPRSKVAFFVEGDNQVQVDAYELVREKKINIWHKKVLTQFKRLRDVLLEDNPKTLEIFDQFFKDLDQKSPLETYNYLQKIRNDKKLQKLSFSLTFFWENSVAYTFVRKSLKKGERIFHNDYLEKKIVKPLIDKNYFKRDSTS